jgi:eukaryotic-like serine/threonine-protein kinase
MRESLHLNPASGLRYSNLVNSYISLNLLAEARATAEQAEAKKLDSPVLHSSMYQLAFLQNDAPEMARQLAWSAGKAGIEDVLLSSEANTAAYFGRLRKAREFTLRAVQSAQRSDEKETAAGYEANLAWTEADVGNSERARQNAAAALSRASNRSVRFTAAMALARAGDSTRAERIADELAKKLPDDTLVTQMEVPIIRGAIEIDRHRPLKAIAVLQAVSPYELGNVDSLYSAYLRGSANLLLHRGSEAAAEFQKILGHFGVVQNGEHGALAHLGLARAYVLSGDTAKARNKYQDFLALWKDADPDIPILKQANTEYAKLQ